MIKHVEPKGDEISVELSDTQDTIDRLRKLRKERDRWRDIAEEKNWPFEWEIATELKQERDKLRHCVLMLSAALETIRQNCNTFVVFDEDGEISSFTNDIKATINLALVEHAKAIGIDYSTFKD